jgi:hypothetical protein
MATDKVAPLDFVPPSDATGLLAKPVVEDAALGVDAPTSQVRQKFAWARSRILRILIDLSQVRGCLTGRSRSKRAEHRGE